MNLFVKSSHVQDGTRSSISIGSKTHFLACVYLFQSHFNVFFQPKFYSMNSLGEKFFISLFSKSKSTYQTDLVHHRRSIRQIHFNLLTHQFQTHHHSQTDKSKSRLSRFQAFRMDCKYFRRVLDGLQLVSNSFGWIKNIFHAFQMDHKYLPRVSDGWQKNSSTKSIYT